MLDHLIGLAHGAHLKALFVAVHHEPSAAATGTTLGRVDDTTRIELTLRLWGAGAPEAFDEYVQKLVSLLPRHRGALERRAAEVDAGPGAPDALLVMSFPDSVSVDSFMRDPLRVDMEDLGAAAIGRSLITDSRHRREPSDDHSAEVVALRTEDNP
jgi:hypothetical protein